MRRVFLRNSLGQLVRDANGTLILVHAPRPVKTEGMTPTSQISSPTSLPGSDSTSAGAASLVPSPAASEVQLDAPPLAEPVAPSPASEVAAAADTTEELPEKKDANVVIAASDSKEKLTEEKDGADADLSTPGDQETLKKEQAEADLSAPGNEEKPANQPGQSTGAVEHGKPEDTRALVVAREADGSVHPDNLQLALIDAQDRLSTEGRAKLWARMGRGVNSQSCPPVLKEKWEACGNNKDNKNSVFEMLLACGGNIG